MGVWKRSPGAREKALEIPALKEAYEEVLGKWMPQDVTGSPYAVYDYLPDPYLFPSGGLKELRAALNREGLGLFVDFVPNHLALDHPWTVSSPGCFIQAGEADLASGRGLFFKAPGGRIFAHGKDPYFPAWTDTVQVNYFSPAYRKAALEILLQIASCADGVRCDMAMLGLNEIFQKSWQPYLKEAAPAQEFWAEIISQVKAGYPGFIFLAEAYWDLEWRLQQLGFDFTYDKRFYDRLARENAESVRGHLRAEPDYQNKSVRFIENHDEPRAVTAFGREKSLAAAAAAMTVPGLRFVHEGQAQGHKVFVPIQLGRGPREKDDKAACDFYGKLFAFANDPVLHQGSWKLLEAGAELLCWVWEKGNEKRLVAINYSNAPAQARILGRDLSFSPWQVYLL